MPNNAEMYTDEGNRAVDRMLLKIEGWVESGRITRLQLENTVYNEMCRVAKTHAEVNDTEPEWYIVDRVNEMCDKLGWKHISRDDLF